jgi:proline dehydrogenase
MTLVDRVIARTLPAVPKSIVRRVANRYIGVEEQLRDIIRAAGHNLRVYIPFGRDWYAYSVRRLRESPRLAGYVFKAMFK